MHLVLWLVGAILLVATWRSHRALARSVDWARPTLPLSHYPSVTVVRPIRGLDAGAKRNLRAALDLDYPNEVETLFVFDDASEPAVAIVRRMLQGRRHNARIIYCGRPPADRTGKLNAMIVGLRKAKGELVAFADSDIRPDRDILRVLVETLLGMPRAESHGGALSFIMGQFMIFKREAIDAIGGLESADGQLVDDMYLGQCLNEAGYRNAVAPRRVPIIQYGMSLVEFAKIYVRWLTFARSGLPARSFKMISWLRGLEFWIGLLAAGLALSAGWWWAASLNLAAALATGASLNALHGRMGGAPLEPRHAWVSFALLFFAPYARIFPQRELDWRGRRYSLAPGARLAR